MPTSATPQSAEADLAFMRALVDGGRPPAAMAGPSIYLAAGLLYGTQCLYHLIGMVTPVHWPPLLTLIVAVGANVLFFTWLGIVVARDRARGLKGPSSSRAVNAVFGAVGLANLALVVIFAVSAGRRQDMAIWLFYPACVFVLQGAAWYVAFVLRRRGWLALVAAGWFAAGIALGLLVEQVAPYLAVCAAALFLLMALPGWIMVRQGRADA